MFSTSTRMMSTSYTIVLFLLCAFLPFSSGHLVDFPTHGISTETTTGEKADATALAGLHNLAASNNAASGFVAPDPTELTLTAQLRGFDFNLTSLLPDPSTTITPLATVPAICADTKGECPAGGVMAASNVTFGDCGDAWTVCRCAPSSGDEGAGKKSMDMALVAERLGRIPVGLRRYVGKVTVMPDSTAHAYSLTNGDITMFGDCQMETFIHESVHAFDFASGSPISASEAWLDALATDSCAPDDYSLTNRIEDFAQVAVLQIYNLAHAGSYPPGLSTDCMSNQLKFMSSLPLFQQETLFANTCYISDDADSANSIDGVAAMNLGAKKTTAPSKPNNDWVFPLPQATATTSTATPTPSGFRIKPSSSIEPLEVVGNAGAGGAVGSLPTQRYKHKPADNAASASVKPPTMGMSVMVWVGVVAGVLVLL